MEQRLKRNRGFLNKKDFEYEQAGWTLSEFPFFLFLMSLNYPLEEFLILQDFRKLFKSSQSLEIFVLLIKKINSTYVIFNIILFWTRPCIISLMKLYNNYSFYLQKCIFRELKESSKVFENRKLKFQREHFTFPPKHYHSTKVRKLKLQKHSTVLEYTGFVKLGVSRNLKIWIFTETIQIGLPVFNI